MFLAPLLICCLCKNQTRLCAPLFFRPAAVKPSRGAAAQRRRLERSTVQARDARGGGSKPPRFRPAALQARPTVRRGGGRRLETSTVQARGASSPPAVRRARGGGSKTQKFRASGPRRFDAVLRARGGGSTSPRFRPRGGSSPPAVRWARGGDLKTLRIRPEAVQARPRCGGQRRRLENSTVQAPRRFKPAHGAAGEGRRLEKSTVPRFRPAAGRRGAAGKGRRLDKPTVQARCGSSPPAVRGPAAATRKLHGSGPRRFKPVRGAGASGGDSKTRRFRPEAIRARPRCGGQRRRLETSTVQARGGSSPPAVRRPAAATRNLHGSGPRRRARPRCGGQRRRLEKVHGPTSEKAVTYSCALDTESGGMGIESDFGKSSHVLLCLGYREWREGDRVQRRAQGKRAEAKILSRTRRPGGEDCQEALHPRKLRSVGGRRHSLRAGV